ncbi:MAG: NAD(+)/NADH kinase [Clostridia bacterium]|nr:NAD(+)/NADH kinase [Clostridia bacterium]
MIGFYFRESNARSVRASEKLKKLLEENGLKYRDVCFAAGATVSDIDLMIVFGGDGSVLRAVKIAFDTVPIVAINTGNVGFLTSYEETELDDLVSAIKNDALKFSSRRLMEVGYGGKKYYALNDITIAKSYRNDYDSECVKLHFHIDGELVDTYVSDGLIISTPTGSTAYALSAGGPVMTPGVNAFVAAPICAHSLHSRPIVFASTSKTTVTVARSTKECVLYVDGEKVDVITPGGVVSTSDSDRIVKICDFSHSFFKRLSVKLNQWSSTDTEIE